MPVARSTATPPDASVRLNEQERKKAIVLFKSLSLAHGAIKQGRALANIKADIRKIWAEENGVRLVYFEVADRENLILLDSVKSPNPSIMLIAGFVGEVRLIDNMIVG